MATIGRLLHYITLISILLIGCNNQECEILSYFENGSIDTKRCLIENDTNNVYIESFYKDGGLKTTYYLKNKLLTGEKIDYFPTGQIDQIWSYDQGTKVECKSYDKSGRFVLYNYYYNGQTAYIKAIKYDSLNPYEYESFVPFIKILNDSVRIGDSLEVEVSLPLPDSIMGDHEFFFEYQMKPISLKDSTMFEPPFRINFSNKKTHRVKIMIESSDDVIFYGHIKDLINRLIHRPTDKLITVLGTDTK